MPHRPGTLDITNSGFLSSVSLWSQPAVADTAVYHQNIPHMFLSFFFYLQVSPPITHLHTCELFFPPDPSLSIVIPPSIQGQVQNLSCFVNLYHLFRFRI